MALPLVEMPYIGNGMGRIIVGIGITFVVIGLLVMLGERLPIRFGRLPGDFVYKSKNTTVYFPLATSVILSVVLSVVMWLLGRK